jgi:hypothetical protein
MVTSTNTENSLTKNVPLLNQSFRQKIRRVPFKMSELQRVLFVLKWVASTTFSEVQKRPQQWRVKTTKKCRIPAVFCMYEKHRIAAETVSAVV